MPPVMGIAAFVLAALSTVPYSEVIIAALIPALLYSFSLLLAVSFEVRKSGIETSGDIAVDQRITRTDWINLIMIVLPLSLIVVLLLTRKSSVGSGVLGWFTWWVPGRELPWFLELYKNAAGDPDSAASGQ